MMARLEKQQRREELQESALFVSGIVATIALLVWAGMHYAPTLDFSIFDFTKESAPLNDSSLLLLSGDVSSDAKGQEAPVGG